jgi:hypothetical protein
MKTVISCQPRGAREQLGGGEKFMNFPSCSAYEQLA